MSCCVIKLIAVYFEFCISSISEIFVCSFQDLVRNILKQQKLNHNSANAVPCSPAAAIQPFRCPFLTLYQLHANLTTVRPDFLDLTNLLFVQAATSQFWSAISLLLTNTSNIGWHQSMRLTLASKEQLVPAYGLCYPAHQLECSDCKNFDIFSPFPFSEIYF